MPQFFPTKLCLRSNAQKHSPEAVKHHLQSSVACTSNGEDRGASGGRSAPGDKSILSVCPPASDLSPLVFNQHRLTPGPVFLHNDILGASVCCHDV